MMLPLNRFAVADARTILFARVAMRNRENHCQNDFLATITSSGIVGALVIMIYTSSAWRHEQP